MTNRSEELVEDHADEEIVEEWEDGPTRVIRLEVEVRFTPGTGEMSIDFDNDRDLAKHAANCMIGNDFEYMAVFYNGEEL